MTTKFIEECKNRANTNRLGKIIVDGLDKPITNSDNLQNFTIDKSCYVDGNIIGSIYISKLTGQLLAIPNDVNLADKTIQASVGVKYADNSNEYVDMGKYTIEHPKDEQTADMTQITAYDELNLKIDDAYVCGIDYEEGNKTLADLYSDVCTQLGFTPKTLDILNKDIPIESNPFTNKEKNRTVLKAVATIACSYVVIYPETKEIDLEWVSDSTEPDYTFEKSDYSTLEGGKIQYGPLNTIIIKNSQIDDENVTKTDDESIALNGEHSIVISEDYILYNSDLRQLAMPAIFERLDGFKYIDCKLVSNYGKPFLPIGAKIRVMTDSGFFDTYNLKHTFTFDGSFISTIESPALTQQEIKTKQNISLQEKLRNTEIEVNKQKGIITSTVETVNEVSKTVNDAVYTAEQAYANAEQTAYSLQNDYYNQEQIDAMQDATKEDLTLVKNSVVETQTSTQAQIDVIQEEINNGVSKVVTTTGTFDSNGLHIQKVGEAMNSILDWDGLVVRRDQTEVLTVRSAGVETENLTVRKYLTVNPIRMEQTKSISDGHSIGLGFFYTGV